MSAQLNHDTSTVRAVIRQPRCACPAHPSAIHPPTVVSMRSPPSTHAVGPLHPRYAVHQMHAGGSCLVLRAPATSPSTHSRRDLPLRALALITDGSVHLLSQLIILTCRQQGCSWQVMRHMTPPPALSECTSLILVILGWAVQCGGEPSHTGGGRTAAAAASWLRSLCWRRPLQSKHMVSGVV